MLAQTMNACTTFRLNQSTLQSREIAVNGQRTVGRSSPPIIVGGGINSYELIEMTCIGTEVVCLTSSVVGFTRGNMPQLTLYVERQFDSG